MTDSGERRVLDIIIANQQSTATKLDTLIESVATLRQSSDDMCRRVIRTERCLEEIEETLLAQGRQLDRNDKTLHEHLHSSERWKRPGEAIITALVTTLLILILYWILGGGLLPIL